MHFSQTRYRQKTAYRSLGRASAYCLITINDGSPLLDQELCLNITLKTQEILMTSHPLPGTSLPLVS